jgi:hypothetical protein
MYTQEHRRRGERLATGEIVGLEEPYVRYIPVPWPVLVATLVFGGIGKLPALALSVLRRGGVAAGAGRRGFSTFRKGPGVVVTPLWVGDGDRGVTEVELHGYVRSDRLMRGDRVRAQLRPQRRADLPPRAVRIHNLTTGQVVAPHPDTLLSHVGLSLVLQSIAGLVLVTVLTAAWAAGR